MVENVKVGIMTLSTVASSAPITVFRSALDFPKLGQADMRQHRGAAVEPQVL